MANVLIEKQTLQDIANAIRSKDETETTMTPSQMASRIEQIPTSEQVKEKDVNFYDYDGTLLHSYTLAEVQELTELPDLPSHEGLICQGWNWTLADIKAENKETDVGAMYITDDGKTRLYIHIDDLTISNVPINFKQSIANGIELDWGDGSAVETFDSVNTKIETTHQYNAVGDYVITFNPLNDCVLSFNNINIFGTFNVQGVAEAYANLLYKVEIGKNVPVLNDKLFYKCFFLRSITLPSEITSLKGYIFGENYSLGCVIIPNTMNTNLEGYSFNKARALKKVSINKQAREIKNYVFSESGIEKITLPRSISIGNSSIFSDCNELKIVSIPTNYNRIGYCMFSKCISLEDIIILGNVTTIDGQAFADCHKLKRIELPEEITVIKSYTFNYCKSLTSISIPKNVTQIQSGAFMNCVSLFYVDMSSHEIIPSLGNTNAFNYGPNNMKIIVPDALYEDWIVATNWSAFESNIIKKSDWEASQV